MGTTEGLDTVSNTTRRQQFPFDPDDYKAAQNPSVPIVTVEDSVQWERAEMLGRFRDVIKLSRHECFPCPYCGEKVVAVKTATVDFTEFTQNTPGPFAVGMLAMMRDRIDELRDQLRMEARERERFRKELDAALRSLWRQQKAQPLPLEVLWLDEEV